MPCHEKGESTRGGLPLSFGGIGGLPREKIEYLALLCAFLMGFYAFETRFQSRFFARKDISWCVRKPNAKQNGFQIVMIFLKLFFSIFLRHYVAYVSAGFGKVLLALILGCHGRIQRGGGQGVRTPPPPPPPPPPPRKITKIRVSKQYWSRSPEKSQSYQASIQCWAIIGPPAKRHLNAVSLAGQ